MNEQTRVDRMTDGTVRDSQHSMTCASLSAGEVRELIANRAYELYKERGTGFSDEIGDWLRAEAELVTMLLAEPPENEKPVSRNGRSSVRTRIPTGGRKASNGARPRVNDSSKRRGALKGNTA